MADDLYNLDTLPEIIQDPQLPTGTLTGNFDSLVGPLLQREGGFANNSKDRGGRTKFGISQRAYPWLDIDSLTEDDAKELYKSDYWDPGFEKMPANVAEMMFDASVNHGKTFANRMYEKTGGDFNAMKKYRADFYNRLVEKDPSQAGFLKGWQNRLEGLGAAPAKSDEALLNEIFAPDVFEAPTAGPVEQQVQVPQPPIDRSAEIQTIKRSNWTAIQDFLKESVGVAAGGLESIASIYDPDSALARDMRAFRKDINENQLSKKAQAINKEVEEAVAYAQKNGEWGVAAWLEQVWKHPMDTLGPEGFGMLLGPGGLGLATKLALGAGKALGVMTAVNGAMTGGEVRNAFYQGVMEAKDADLQQHSPLYKKLRETHDEITAKRKLGSEVDSKLLAGTSAMMALGFVTGRTGFESAILGKAKGGFLKSGAIEGGTEFGDEFGTTVAGNVAKTSINPSQEIFEGAPLAGVQGAAVGGPLGMVGRGIGALQESDTVIKPPVDPDTVNKQREADASNRLKQQLADLENQLKSSLPAQEKVSVVQIPDPWGKGVMLEVRTDSAMYKEYMAKQNSIADQENGFIKPRAKDQLQEWEGWSDAYMVGKSVMDNPPPLPTDLQFPQTKDQFALPFPGRPTADPITKVDPKDPQMRLLNPDGGNAPLRDYEADIYVNAQAKPPQDRTKHEQMIIDRLDTMEQVKQRAVEEAYIDRILRLHKEGVIEQKLIDQIEALHQKHLAEDKAMAEYMWGNHKKGESFFQLRKPSEEIPNQWLPPIREEPQDHSETHEAIVMLGKRDPAKLLDWAIENSPSKEFQFIANRTRGFVRAYLANGGKINVKTGKNPNAYGHTISHPPTEGGYKKQFRTIDVTFYDGANLETILHEFVHAATINMIGQFDSNQSTFRTLFPKEASAVADMHALFQSVREQKGIGKHAVEMQNVYEFVAYGLTNVDFVDYLKTVPYKKSNAFVEFFRYLGKMLGLDENPNAHGELMRIFDSMLRVPDKAAQASAMSQEEYEFNQTGKFSNITFLHQDPRGVSEEIANTTPFNGVRTVMTANTKLDDALKDAEAKIELDYQSSWRSVSGKLYYKVDPNDPNPVDSSGISSIAFNLSAARKAVENPEWAAKNPGLVAAIEAMSDKAQKIATKVRKQAKESGNVRMQAMSNIIGNDPSKMLQIGLTDPEYSQMLQDLTYKEGEGERHSLYKHYLEALGGVMGIKSTDANSLGALSLMLEKASNTQFTKTIPSDSPSHKMTPTGAMLRLPGMAGRFQSIATLGELETAMENAPQDIDRSTFGSNMRPGMRHLAIKTGHPIIQFVNYRIDRAFSKAKFKMKAVSDASNPDALISLYQQMSYQEREEVATLMTKAGIAQVKLDTNNIRNLSPVQARFINQYYSIDADVLAEQHNAARATGQELIHPVEGHVATKFSGTWRAIIRESSAKDAKPIGFVGEDSQRGFEAALKKVKERYPNSSAVVLPERNINETFNHMKTRSDLAKQLQESGVVNEEVLELAAAIDNQMYSMDKRAKPKLGIWGGDGNKFWRSDKQNVNDFFQGQFTYFEEAYKHHALQSPLHDIRRAGLQYASVAPNAIKEAEYYVDTVVSGAMNPYGKALNTIIDAALKQGSAGFGSYNRFSKFQSEVRDYLTTMVLGWFDFQYMLAQIVQPLQTGSPFVNAMASDLKMNPAEVTAAAGRVSKVVMGYMSGYKLPGTKLDPDQQAAVGYALEEGIMGMSQMEHKSALVRSKGAQKLKNFSDWSIRKTDSMTRFPMFMLYYEILRASEKGRSMPQADLLDAAKNMTQYSMVDYNHWQRPLLYARTGVVGSYLGTFRSYAHGNWGQMQTLWNLGQGKLKGTKSNAKPFLWMMAVLFSLGGAAGMPGFEETDELLQYLTKKLNNGTPLSTKEFLMKNFPAQPWITKGFLSHLAGYDFSSKYAIHNVVPSWDNLAAPLGILSEPISAFLSAADQFISDGVVSPNRTKELVKQVIPKSARNAFDTAFNVDETITPSGQPIDALFDKYGEVKDYLTKEERADREHPLAQIAGVKPLRESMRQETDRINREANKSEKLKMEELSKRLNELFRTGSITGPTYVNIKDKYIELGGTEDRLLASAIRNVEASRIPSILREIGKGEITKQDRRATENPYRGWK